MNINVYGNTLFAMSVRSVIGSRAWSLDGGSLYSSDGDLCIPVFPSGKTADDAARDAYGCSLEIDGEFYGASSCYYAIDPDGGSKEIAF